MKKADIRLRDFLTLIGPNTVVRIIDDTIPAKSKKEEEQAEEQTVRKGIAVRIFKELEADDGTMIKHISPNVEFDTLGRYVVRIYVY